MFTIISDPPENIEMSERYVSVHEGDSPEKILCTAEAYPKANYHWEFQGETVGTDNLLFFDQGIKRAQAGEYKCIAENRHGKKEITTHFDVQCKYIHLLFILHSRSRQNNS